MKTILRKAKKKKKVDRHRGKCWELEKERNLAVFPTYPELGYSSP